MRSSGCAEFRYAGLGESHVTGTRSHEQRRKHPPHCHRLPGRGSHAAFGAGDKTLHNVCGRVGVLEGNAGDSRPGLPLQSVHDGKHFVHEPVRLSAFIAAEPEAISEVLSRQPKVRELVDNGWLFLFTLDDAGHTTHRYTGSLSWEALA